MSDHPVTDARAAPRYAVDFPAVVETDWQESCHALVSNLSQQGLCLEGGRELVDKVFPNFNPGRGRPLRSVRVVFTVGQQIDQPQGCAEVDCQTVYVRRASQSDYQIGMEFVDIREDSMDLLEQLLRWLEHHGTPLALNSPGSGHR